MKYLKKLSVVLYNGSKYGCHFIIKELAEEFKAKIKCLGENLKKCLTFLISIENELKNYKRITYRTDLFIYLFIYLFIHLFTYLLPAYVSHYWTDKILTNTYICIIPDA